MKDHADRAIFILREDEYAERGASGRFPHEAFFRQLTQKRQGGLWCDIKPVSEIAPGHDRFSDYEVEGRRQI